MILALELHSLLGWSDEVDWAISFDTDGSPYFKRQSLSDLSSTPDWIPPDFDFDEESES